MRTGGGRLGSVFRGASKNSGAGLGANVSQMDLCGLLNAFFGAREGLQSRGNRFLGGRHLFGVRSRNLSYKDVAKGSICSCGGIFYFLEESKYRVVEFSAVPFEVLNLLKERERTVNLHFTGFCNFAEFILKTVPGNRFLEKVDTTWLSIAVASLIHIIILPQQLALSF